MRNRSKRLEEKENQTQDRTNLDHHEVIKEETDFRRGIFGVGRVLPRTTLL